MWSCHASPIFHFETSFSLFLLSFHRCHCSAPHPWNFSSIIMPSPPPLWLCELHRVCLCQEVAQMKKQFSHWKEEIASFFLNCSGSLHRVKCMVAMQQYTGHIQLIHKYTIHPSLYSLMLFYQIFFSLHLLHLSHFFCLICHLTPFRGYTIFFHTCAIGSKNKVPIILSNMFSCDLRVGPACLKGFLRALVLRLSLELRYG